MRHISNPGLNLMIQLLIQMLIQMLTQMLTQMLILEGAAATGL